MGNDPRERDPLAKGDEDKTEVVERGRESRNTEKALVSILCKGGNEGRPYVDLEEEALSDSFCFLQEVWGSVSCREGLEQEP